MLCLCTGIKKNRRRKQNGRHCSYRVDFIKEKPEKIELRSSFYVYGRILYNKNDIIPLVFATPLVFTEWQKMKKKKKFTYKHQMQAFYERKTKSDRKSRQDLFSFILDAPRCLWYAFKCKGNGPFVHKSMSSRFCLRLLFSTLMT